jgi:phenylacetate-CoA ligase
MAYLPADRIRRLRRRRVQVIVRHAYESVPFYREAMRKRGLDPGSFRDPGDLSLLPLIGPEEVRGDPERFASSRIPPHARTTSYSSGTTGTTRGVVFRDENAVLDSLAKGERDRAIITALAGERHWLASLRELAGRGPAGRLWAWLLDPRGEHRRVSIFMTTHSASAERIRWSRRTLMPRSPAHHHHLPASAPLEEALHRFRVHRPRIAFSFGSYAERFLRLAASQPEPVPLPRVWAFVGDGVSEGGWRLASELGVRLWSGYSAVETGRLGFQCEVGRGHHLNADACDVRIVNADGREQPAGEQGELVVSNLINRATVILNFRLGDLGAMARTPCPCGRTLPLLAEMRGRTSDLIMLADGRVLTALVFDAMFRWELRQALSSHVSQLDPGRLRWTIVPVPGVDRDRLRDEVLERAEELAPGTEIELVVSRDVPTTASGKTSPVRAPAIEQGTR